MTPDRTKKKINRSGPRVTRLEEPGVHEMPKSKSVTESGVPLYLLPGTIAHHINRIQYFTKFSSMNYG
jgi:hypothetical protein